MGHRHTRLGIGVPVQRQAALVQHIDAWGQGVGAVAARRLLVHAAARRRGGMHLQGAAADAARDVQVAVATCIQ